MERIAVIILNYNTWQDTLNEIELLKTLEDADCLDIVVVDNASPNGSYDELIKYADNNFTLLKAESNRGYAAGNNIGLKYAFENGYRFAWILNNDILFEDADIIGKLYSVFEQDGSIAVVNPDVYSPQKYLFNRDSVRPSFYDLTLGMFAYRKKGRRVKDLGGYGFIYRPQGCCMLVDLNKVSEVGYLDEHTFLYSEESILAERLLKKQYKCACCLNCGIIHNHSQTVKSNIKQRKIKKIQLASFDYYLKEYRGYKRLKRCICRLFFKLKLSLLK